MDDFYHADVNKKLIDSDLLEEISSKSDPSIYLKVPSILLVRAGLFLSQVSSIPSSNIQILIFQNIIDIAVNTVVYSLIGYLFAFGKDSGTFIGIDGFLAEKSNRSEFVEGWLIVIAVSGLVVAAVGDRISFISSLVLNVLISGIVFPLFIHWILSEWGWMRVQTFARIRVSYKDYSYSCLIHMSGGFLAFISMLVLNKRLLRFKDMDVCSIPDNGPSLTLFGNFFMIIGFFGIGVPTEKYFLTHLDYNFYGIVMTNMLLSAFGAVSTALLLTFLCPCEPLHKWTSMRSIQAGISGIAVIAGGADVYHPLASLIVGVCNGVIFFFVSFLVNISPIEDYSNIIACHFVSGLLGTLLPPVLGIREGFHTTPYLGFMHLTWQLLCDMAILGMLVTVFTPITFLLDYFSILRSWDEDINHRRAVFASRTIKLDSENAFPSQPQQQEVNYLEPEYGQQHFDGQQPFDGQLPFDKQQDEPIQDPENVDVLYENKGPENEQQKVDDGPMTSNKFEKTISNTFLYNGALNFDDEKYLVNYVLNSRPLTFFEDMNSSRGTSEIKVRDGGDNCSSKNPKVFDIKLMKGIRNISDSKLLNKFKETRTAPKKRGVWNRERELRNGTVSNIWFPSSVRINIETQV